MDSYCADVQHLDILVQHMDILVEGERIRSNEDLTLSPGSRLDAPHSAPHSRSSSFKNRPRPKLNIDIQLATRPRTNSLPNAYLPLPEPFYIPEVEQSSRTGFHRVRSFKTTSKGLINHGDSMRLSTNSLASNGSASSNPDIAKSSSRRNSYVSDVSGPGSNCGSKTNLQMVYRVLMMGPPGVGKTSLTRQFMTSEYKGTYAESTTPEIIEPERNVNVLLDGEESVLHFLDEEQHPDFVSEELPIDAYVVVFSVSNVNSYNQAVESIKTLRNVHGINKAVILVGNKIDIARQRRVQSEDAMEVSEKYHCRYTETSAALNHQVDELLIGILSQIREQINPSGASSLAPPKDKNRSRSKSPGRVIHDFFSKIFGQGDKRAKSCETLFVQ